MANKYLLVKENPYKGGGQVDTPPNNEIWYTTTDAEEIELTTSDGGFFGTDIEFVETIKSNNKFISKFSGDVTSIRMSSPFSNNSRLSTFIMPNSVTTIGIGAFRACSSLESISLSNSITKFGEESSETGYIFYNCTNLKSITIPEGVKTIGNYCFYNCASLSTIDIPKTITGWIGSYAFYGCEKLTNIVFHENVSGLSEGCLSASGLSSITLESQSRVSVGGPTSPLYSTSIEHIYVPRNLYDEYIESDGWKNYSDKIFAISDKPEIYSFPSPSANEIYYKTYDGKAHDPYILKDGDTPLFVCDYDSSTNTFKQANIVSNVYNGDYGVITFDNSLIGINSNSSSEIDSFYKDRNKTTEDIFEYVIPPSTMEYNGGGVTTSIIIPNGVKDVSSYLSGGMVFDLLYIPKTVNDIGNMVVYGNIYVDKHNPIYISDSNNSCLIKYSNKELVLATNNTSTILDGITSIAAGAFGRLTIENVIIPDTVTSISMSAFIMCMNLVSITFKGNTPPSINADSIRDCVSLSTIYVPAEAVETYKTAENFTKYASIIKAIE